MVQLISASSHQEAVIVDITAARRQRLLRTASPAATYGLVLTAVSLLLVALHVAVPSQPLVAAWSRDDSRVRAFFDLGAEMSLPTWFSVLMLIVATLTHAAAGMLARLAGDRSWWAWWVTAAMCLAMSVDEFAGVHEQLDGLGRALGGGSGLTHAAWVIPGLLLGLAAVGAIAELARRVGAPGRRYLGGGIALLVGGALGVEAIANAGLEQWGFGRRYALLLIVEELAEMTGAALLGAGALRCLTARRDGGGVVVSYAG